MQYVRKCISDNPINISGFGTVDTGAKFKQYDTNTSILVVDLLDGEELANIENEVIYVSVKSKNKLVTNLYDKYSSKKIEEPKGILTKARSISGNRIEIMLSPLVLQESGNMVGEILVVDMITSQRITSQQFTFDIEASLTPNQEEDISYTVIEDLDGTYITDSEELKLLAIDGVSGFKLSFTGLEVNEILQSVQGLNYEENNEALESLNQKDEEIQESIKAATKEREKINSEIILLKNKDSELDTEIEQLNLYNSTNDLNINEIKSNLSKLEEYNSSNDIKIQTIDREIESLKEYDETNTSSINEIKEDIVNLKLYNSSNDENIRNINSNIEDFKQYNSNNTEVVNRINSDLQSYKSSNNQAVSDIRENLESYKTSNNQSVNSINENLENFKNTANQNINDINVDISSLKDYNTTNDSKIEEINGGIERNTNSISENLQKINSNTSLIEVNKEAISSINLKNEEIERDLTSSKENIENNKNDILNLNKKVNKNTEDIKLLKEGSIGGSNSNKEVIDARTATTGEIFDTLDERIDHEVDELRKEVEVNKVNIEDLTEKTGSNLKLIQSNTTKISSNTSEIEKIKQYNTNNDSKISNIENSIEENTNNISTNTNKIGELENKANTNESNISSNASKIELIEGEIETLKQYDSSNDTKISEIESKVDTNKSGIANNSSKIEQAMSKIEENKTNISGNSSKISVLENKIPTIESNISSNTSKIELIEGKVGSLETTVSGNSSSIEEVKGEVATIKSSVSSNTSEVSKLKEKLSGIEPNVTSVVSKVGEIERQIPAIESKISGNTSNISTVKTKVEKNTSDITKISKRLDGLVVNPNVDLEEIVQARTATTGEIFDTLDERIDNEVDRLNKKIDVTMLQQEDKESYTIENSVEELTTDMVIKGRTLQNVAKKVEIRRTLESVGVEYSTIPIIAKNNTEYTLVLDVTKNTTSENADYWGIYLDSAMTQDSIVSGSISTGLTKGGFTGRYIFKFRSKDVGSITNMGIGMHNDYSETYEFEATAMLLEGDWTNKPIPKYFESIKSFGQQEDKISILSSGANLINPSKCVDGFIYQSDIDKNKKTTPCFELNLVKGTTYFFTEEVYGCYLDNSRKFIENVGFVGNKLVSKYTGIAVFRPHIPYSQENSNYKNLQEFINKFMVNEGQNLLPYESYKCNKKDILLNLYGFENGLNGINDISDELNSIRNVAIKKINKYINSNNETINIHTIRNNTISFNYNFIRNTPKGKNSNPNFIANCFVTNLACYSNDVEGCFGTPSGFYGSISKAKLESPDIEGVTKYIRENFKECYFELAEPVETPLSENINLKTFGERTYVSFENSLSGTSSFKAPVDTTATISRLNRENRALEEENRSLGQDFELTTLSLTYSDLELVKQNVDIDFRLMEVEFALDIPQSTLSSNINFKNKKGEVKSMARTPYEMMKIVILSGDYDREDYIHKVRKYYERGRMTKEEHDELMSLMTADEVISKKN